MEQITLKQKQKQEALKRMKKLNILDNVIQDFERKEKLYVSFKAILYWLTDDEKELVKKWEAETGNLVYHVIVNYFEFGKCYSFLYISKHEDEWEYDNEDLNDGYPYAYVKNVTDDFCSEYGRIGIASAYGGILRTA